MDAAMGQVWDLTVSRWRRFNVHGDELLVSFIHNDIENLRSVIEPPVFELD